MKYRRLGSSGLKVSNIGLGMMSYGDPTKLPWSLSEDAAEPIVRRAVEAGVTLFDTADMYSSGASEEVTGRILKKLFNRRSDYVLATKVYYPMGSGTNSRGLSRKHIMDSVDASLRRLNTDYLDLYQIHRWDNESPIEETVAALADIVRAGKVRYLGASLMYAWQFAKAQSVTQLAGGVRFVSMQTRYNLVYREEEREMIPLCLDQGVGILPYSPLAGGLLARNTAVNREATPRSAAREASNPRIDPNDIEVIDTLETVAAKRGVPQAQIALAWLMNNAAVTAPIVGATKSSHVDSAVAAADLTLSTGEIGLLNAPYRPRKPYGYS